MSTVWSRIDGERGPLVVFTHGWGATAHMWAPQVDALRDRARVVTWDLLGHGRSETPDDPGAYSLAGALAELDRLIGEERAVLVGHSLGGVLSMTFATRHAERVAGLGLLSTGPGFRDDAARAKWNGNLELQAEALERRGFDALSGGGDDLHGGLHTSPLALAHAIRGFVSQQDASLMDALPTITAPALVLVGEKDRGFLGAADYMAAKLPNAWKVVVPDAGHLVNRHQPAAVNAALVDLLERAEGQTVHLT